MIDKTTFLTKEQGIFERLFKIIGILKSREFDCNLLEERTKNSERLLVDLDINTLWLIVSKLLINNLDKLENLLDTKEDNEENIEKLILEIEKILKNINDSLNNELILLNKSSEIFSDFKYDKFILCFILILNNYKVGIIQDYSNKISLRLDPEYYLQPIIRLTLNFSDSNNQIICQFDDFQEIISTTFYLNNTDNKYSNTDIIKHLLEINENRKPQEWILEFRFLGNQKSSSIAKLIYVFSSLLESIDGTYIEIEEWGTGSLWAKIKAIFTNKENQTKAKEYMGKGRQAIESNYIDKYIEEQKLREINIATKELELQTKIDEKDLNLEQKKLEIEKAKLEIEERKIEIAKSKLDLIKQFAYATKEEMINLEEVEILINGKPYLSLNNEKLIAGSSMNEIENSKLEGKKKDT